MDREFHIAVAIERTNGYARELIRGIADFAAAHENLYFHLIDPERIRRPHEDFDAFICRVDSDATAARLKSRGKPVIDLFCRKPYADFTAVRPDTAAIGRMAAEHFLERRFRNFAFCGFESLRFSNTRCAAYAAALAEHGFPVRVHSVPAVIRRTFRDEYQTKGTASAEADRVLLRKWLRGLPKPVAIFCCDDFRAHHVVELCRETGLAIPKEVAVLGVDDDPVLCTFSSPRLSSVNPDAYGIGRTAAETVAARLEGKRADAAIRIPPKGVIARTSTETYPLDPPWLSDAMVFIARNAKSGISASDVFRHIGLSHTTVQDAFRRTLGSAVQREIIAARLEEAKRLLSSTKLPVTEIARQSGFSDVCYFTRAFTRALRTSPLRYRQSQSN